MNMQSELIDLFYELLFKSNTVYREYAISIDPSEIRHLEIDVYEPEEFNCVYTETESRSFEAGVIHVKYWIDKRIRERVPMPSSA